MQEEYLKEVKELVNKQVDVKEQIARFQEASKNNDNTTIYEIFFHTSCQYLKKKQGKCIKFDRLVDIANDMSIFCMKQYSSNKAKNPNYVCHHMGLVHFAYLHTVYYLYKKLNKEESHYSLGDKDIIYNDTTEDEIIDDYYECSGVTQHLTRRLLC